MKSNSPSTISWRWKLNL